MRNPINRLFRVVVVASALLLGGSLLSGAAGGLVSDANADVHTLQAYQVSFGYFCVGKCTWGSCCVIVPRGPQTPE